MVHAPSKTIVITGGNFINKGAESMLHATVAGIRAYFPGYEPVLVDVFPSLGEEKKARYDFRIVNMHVRTLFRISFPWIQLFVKPKPISNDEQTIRNIFANASAVFDISGYGLSSHNQALIWSIATLLPVRLARKYRVPVYLLPQSMGPFDFKGFRKILFNLFGKSLLNYPEVAFVREPPGLSGLQRVRNRKSQLSPDIVLQTPEERVTQNGNGVLVIPNKQLFGIAKPRVVLEIYQNIILRFIKNGVPVKVIRHSFDDLDFCQRLSKQLSHNLLTIDTSEQSLETIHEHIALSRFVVSGRYHGAIHALKQNKPVIIIGWAEKYRHLASRFGLEKALVDLQHGEPINVTDKVVDALISNEGALQQTIQRTLETIQQESFWRHINLK